MAFLDFFKTFAERYELGIAQMLAQPGNQHDLNLAASFPLIHITQDLAQHLGIQNERFDIVSYRLDVDILVDEIHSFGTQSMPEELAIPARRLNGLIDLCKPAVVILIRAEHGIW